MSDAVELPEPHNEPAPVRTRDDKGLIYPFDTKPQPGEAIEVAKGVWWLRMPIPFVLDHINLWLLEDGDGWTVIDTSVNEPNSRNHWEMVFKTYLKGRPIKRVLVTHMHPDHVGLAGWLCERFQAPLLMSRTDYLMCRMLVMDTGKEAPEEGLNFYRAAGFSDEHLDAYTKRFGGFGMGVSRIPQAFQRVQEGDVLTIGDRDWTVVTGRGHAPEHVCLWHEGDNLFISGDQILPRISSNVSVFPTEPDGNPLQDWLDSCARLRDMLPDETLVLPAHNIPFMNVKKRLQDLIDGHEEGMDKLMAMLGEPITATQCFPALFRSRITRGNYMAAAGESLAHLNCLMARGAVRRDRGADGVDRYSRA